MCQFTSNGGGGLLKGVRLVKLDWVTKRAVASHMARGATDAESGVKDCLKQRPMSRNLELRGRIGAGCVDSSGLVPPDRATRPLAA